MSITMSRKIIQGKMNDYNIILQKTKKHPGYLGKMTSLLFNGIDLEDLCTLYDDLILLRHRNINIDIYKPGCTYEDICDTIIKENKRLEIAAVKNELPKVLKKLYIDLNNYNKNEYDTLFLELGRHRDKASFFSKISRYTSITELKNAIIIFLKDGINDKDSIIKKVEELDNSFIVSNNEKHLIVQVDTQDDIKVLGSDTSWCIVNSSSNWRHYTKNGTQFILYDFTKDIFDPNSKIGFTINYDGKWKASHDKLDKYIHENTLIAIGARLNFNIRSLRYIHNKEIIPLKKILKTTGYSRYDEFASYCEPKEAIAFCKKIHNFNRCDKARIDKSIAIVIDRLYADGISIAKLDKLLSFDRGIRIIRYTSNSLYSNKGYFIEYMSIDSLKEKIHLMNVNQMTIDSLSDYTLSYKKLDTEKRKLIYTFLLVNEETHKYTKEFDKSHFKKICFILGLSLGIDIKELEIYGDILSFEEKIEFRKLLPPNYILLEPTKGGNVIEIPNSSHSSIKKANYSNIYMHRNNVNNIMKFIEYNTGYDMHITVKDGVIHAGSLDGDLAQVLIKALANPGILFYHNNVSYSYDKK